MAPSPAVFGTIPVGPLVQGPDGTFYGATGAGGPNGHGSIYRVQGPIAQGTYIASVVASFDASIGSPGAFILARDGNLYGIAGSSFFKLPSTGGPITVLHQFVENASDGWDPTADVFQGDDGNFYGETFLSGPFPHHGPPSMYRITPAGQYSVVTSLPVAPAGPPSSTKGPNGDFFGTTGTLSPLGTPGAFYRFSPANGAFTVLGSGDQVFKGPLTWGLDGAFYGAAAPGYPSDGIFRLDPSSGAITSVYATPPGIDNSPATGLVLGPDTNFYGARGSSSASQIVYSFGLDGVTNTVHSFPTAAGSPLLVRDGLTVSSDGTLYGLLQASDTQNASIVRFSLPWAGTFDSRDATLPWVFPDWSYGEYKFECPFKQAVPVGLSTAPWSGAAHSALCKEPLGPDFPFSTDQSRSTRTVPATSLLAVENVETFFDHDSADVGSHTLPQFPGNDWDWYHFKGECPLNKHIVGFAQTGNWYASAPSGSGTKPPFTMDTILCSSSSCESPSHPYVTRNQCSVRTLPGDDRPANVPEGDWAPGYYKLQCDDGQAIVGVSVDTVTHQPHRILCCQLEATTC
jgi:hypothetical protein